MTIVGGLTLSTSYTCYVVAKNWNGEEVCSSGVDLNPFYLDTNGVTVKCPGVALGASFTLGDVTYTKRDRDGLLLLVRTANEADLATSCTTGVTNMKDMFYVRAPPSRVLLLL